MLQNYFFLNRLVIELEPALKDSVIEEIFSQDKSKLVIVTSKDSKVFYLEMSVIPGNSFISLRDNFSRAKKNTINIFNELIGQQINTIEIASDDRVLKFNCSRSELFYAIRGKFTNIFSFSKSGSKSGFKSIEDQSLPDIEQEFKQLDFIRGWNSIKINLFDSEVSIAEIRKKYPFIGSEIVKEVKARVKEENPDELLKIFCQILNEIKSTSPCVFINEIEQKVEIAFENFKSFPYEGKRIFKNVIDAINFTLSKKYFLSEKYFKLKLIRNYLDRELKKTSSKINNLQVLIERGSNEESYKKCGNLILANLNSIKSRMTSIVVEDIIDGEGKIEIELNPRLSAQKNADYYFDKSRSERISFAKNSALLQRAKKDFENLITIEKSLENKLTIKELDEIMDKLKIKVNTESSGKEDLSSKFKQYIIDDKYKVYVGKDSKNNDLLTTKFAKQNDYWFHARGVSGSHLVLEVENTKEAIPKPVLKKAASLAAFHSKAKTAGVVPVAYTFKKYVVKKKGDPMGTVHLLREDVLLVKPEIPNGCEFVID